MNVLKLVELKKVIGQLISEESGGNFPKTVTFNRGIEYPKYKVTIEEIDEDYFVDSKGQKWAKVRSEDDDK